MYRSIQVHGHVLNVIVCLNIFIPLNERFVLFFIQLFEFYLFYTIQQCLCLCGVNNKRNGGRAIKRLTILNPTAAMKRLIGTRDK